MYYDVQPTIFHPNTLINSESYADGIMTSNLKIQRVLRNLTFLRSRSYSSFNIPTARGPFFLEIIGWRKSYEASYRL